MNIKSFPSSTIMWVFGIVDLIYYDDGWFILGIIMCVSAGIIDAMWNWEKR